MDSTYQVINHIDETLKKKVFNSSRFASAKYAGACSQYTKVDDQVKTTVLCSVDDSGEGNAIYPDDINSLLIYHKISGSNVSTDKEQVGRTNDYITRITNCNIVVVGHKDQLKINSASLETLLIAGFPDIIQKGVITNAALRFTNIKVLGSDYDCASIYKREWPDSEKPLSPDLILLEMKYQIVCGLNKSCINPCCD